MLKKGIASFSAHKDVPFKREKIIRGAALFLLCLLALLISLSLFQFAACFFEAKRVPEIPAFPAVRFIIYGRGVDTVSARLVLCDTQGSTIAEIERSWKGTALSLEFASASFGEKTMYVPYRITVSGQGGFAAFQPVVTSGTALKKYFFKGGKTLFFSRETRDAQKAAYVFSRFALNVSTRIGSRFGGVMSMPLSECQAGVYYSVMLDTSGSVFLVKE